MTANLPVTTDAHTAAARVNHDLEDRYGAARRTRADRRFAWIIAGVLIAAAVGFFVFSGWQETNQVEVQDIGFSEISSHEAQVKFLVSRPADAAVFCAVEALNASKATIGWNVIEVPPSPTRSQTVTTRLLTTEPFVAANAKTCWIHETR